MELIKLFTRLRVGLNHFGKTYFAAAVGILKQLFTFLLQCSNYLNQRKNLFNKVSNTERSLLNQNAATTAEPFLFGSNGLNYKENA